MTLQSGALPVVWPGIITLASAAPSLAGTDTLDAAGEYAAVVQCAAQDMVITHVGFRCQAASGSPTADVRIETVDPATGLPTGTLWGTNTNIVTATLTTSWALHALTAAATISKGQWFATKVGYASGTSFQVQGIGGVIGLQGLPYFVTNTTGSAVKGNGGARNWAFGSSSTVFYPLRNVLPCSSVAQNAFNNTNAAKRGIRFQVPWPCQAVGMRMYLGTALGDFNFGIFDDAGVELNSSLTAFEGDCHLANAISVVNIHFDNPVTLAPGTWYRAVQEPSSTTNINMYTAVLPSADYRSAWPGGTNFHYTTFASAAWDDAETDQVPFMDLLLKQFDDGAGSGVVARVIGG